MTDALRVLIADDHVPTRAGVRMALERAGLEVAAEAANRADAVRAAVRERPDVCLLDIDMPGGGITAVAEICAALPSTQVVMLTVSPDEGHLFEALRAGAIGYLLKDMDPWDLPDAVRRAAAGEPVLAEGLTLRLVEQLRRQEAPVGLPVEQRLRVKLTPRERQVLELIGEGSSTAQIAARLGLSAVTVRRHTAEVLHKLNVPSREEARRLLARPGRGQVGSPSGQS